MKKIIIIGAGTFSSVVVDSIRENPVYEDYSIMGLLDDEKTTDINFNFPVLGKIDEAESFAGEDIFFVIALGNCQARKKIFQKHKALNYLTVIDKSANISENAIIGKGCIILKNTSINALTEIGDFSIVNTGAIIDHHCKIDCYCHVGQGAVLWNCAKLESEQYVLPGTVIKG